MWTNLGKKMIISCFEVLPKYSNKDSERIVKNLQSVSVDLKRFQNILTKTLKES
jgi:hypothetical protein